jgi:hypothetical protein
VLSFFSLGEYFSLVFSKMLSRPGKHKVYTFLEEVAEWYEKWPDTIAQDVTEMRIIAHKLKLALGPREAFRELRAFEPLPVTGEIPRLIFHLAH